MSGSSRLLQHCWIFNLEQPTLINTSEAAASLSVDWILYLLKLDFFSNVHFIHKKVKCFTIGTAEVLVPLQL